MTYSVRRRTGIPTPLLHQLDRLSLRAPIATDGRMSVLFHRSTIFAILLFGLTVPHSIAAAQICFLGGIIFWLGRDLAQWRLSLTRTSIDRPLFCFVLLTFISSVFSLAPATSIARCKSLGLFLIFYLIVGNLARRGAIVLLVCLLISSLVGVGFSLTEKLLGRGMVIAYVAPESQFARSGLRPGDLIWMIGRQRVSSPEEIGAALAKRRVGEIVSVEALHAGDPVPVVLTVDERLRSGSDALGIRGDGRSRRFRASGFGRQFITWAEQMQMLGLFALGLLLAGIGKSGRLITVSVFLLFVTGLMLTATRSVIASFVIALILVTIEFGGRRIVAIAIPAALLISVVGTWSVISARRETIARFSDDSTMRRIGYMKAGLRIIPEHPLLGIGMDSHKQFWHDLKFPGNFITHTHSTPIQIAMDRGIPALACLIWLVITVWRRLRSLHGAATSDGDRIGAGLAIGGIAALTGFSLSALTNYNFGDSESLMMLIAIIGAVNQTRLTRLQDGPD